MPIKRENSFFSEVFNIWDAREVENREFKYWQQAVEIVLIGEFRNIGIPKFYLVEMLKNGEVPASEWIEICIEQTKLFNHALEPLTVRAYEVAGWILRQIWWTKQTMEDNDAEYHPPEYWLSFGLSLGLHSELVGEQTIRDIVQRIRNSEAGKGNAGVVKSPSSIAFAFAVNAGHKTGAPAWEYFENNSKIKEKNIDITIEYERAEFSDRILRMKFKDNMTGQTSNLISKGSMSSMMARAKAHTRSG